ncbi:MAG: OsmC family protein [Nitrospirota bacterium]|nr:MAG: OsmC family protein [Nitrospirota bacterium]
MSTQTIQESTTVNGVNVDQQEETIQAVKTHPEFAQFQFRAHNQWHSGAHNRIQIDNYYGTCKELPRGQTFTLTADQPSTLLGTNKGPTPFEYLLTALSSCMTTSLVYQAAAEGIAIEALESDYEGDINLQGILGLNPNVRKGYEEIRVKIKVRSNRDKARLHELVQNSPILDVIRNPTPVTIEFVGP